MKHNLLRVLLLFLVSTFVLTAFAGCQTSDGVTNPSGTEAATEAQPQETEDKGGSDIPKEPINLNGYTIVIPDGATDVSVEGLAAYELKEALRDLGYSVQVKEDDGSASVDKNSILFGKTAATDASVPETTKYSVSEKNGQIQVLAGSYYGYRSAIGFIKSNLMQENGFPRGIDYTGTAVISKVNKNGTSFRIMFYNVLGYDWKGVDGNTADPENTPSVALRQDMQRDLLAVYQPDVIGFQEYAREYLSSFDAVMTSVGYTKVPVSKENNNSPMFYRADRVRLVESGFSAYTTSESVKSNRGVTWAVFQEISTNKQFAVFNTHFLHSVDSNTEKWDTERENNAKDALAVIEEIKSQYAGIPVIFGGDLNSWNVWSNYSTASSRKAYETLTNSQTGKLTLASNVSGVETNFWTSSNTSNYTNSYHGYYRYDSTQKTYDMTQSNLINQNKSRHTLDHIFVGNTSGMKLGRHYIIEDELTLRASDHCPVLIDFTLRQKI